MRVLFYNWTPPAPPGGPGGGIAASQYNLWPALQSAGIVAGHLSSGIAQELRPGPPRWEETAPLRYRLVNARPFAPGHASFGDPTQLSHPPTEAAFESFLQATGPWDAIQFDSLEGLPAAALAIAKRHSRCILVLHNHYPVCPQVNLWHQERQTCQSFENGAACTRCLPEPPLPEEPRRRRLALRHTVLEAAGAPGLQLYSGLTTLRRALKPAPPPSADQSPAPIGLAADFAARRAQMVAAINQNCDRVLCVSNRVKELALGFGIAPSRLHVAPIGSPDARRARPETRALLNDQGQLTLAYTGYLRRDKGFWFLLEALEALPAPLAQKVQLILAAKPVDRESSRRIEALTSHLAGLTWHQSYTPADLDRILAPATLGVVPVLWEDNLPQVAIEMHLRGLALLTSDLGGARELGNAPRFTFQAGNRQDFHNRLEAILGGEIRSRDYGKAGYTPGDMTEHLVRLLPHWQCQRS